jgi:hypothetical protein
MRTLHDFYRHRFSSLPAAEDNDSFPFLNQQIGNITRWPHGCNQHWTLQRRSSVLLDNSTETAYTASIEIENHFQNE